jgi:hypothetical protein
VLGKLKQFRVPRKIVWWYLFIALLSCCTYTTWGLITDRPDYMMGIFGSMVVMLLINNIDNKGKWSGVDTLIFVVFGLTTVMIPFIT